MMFVYSYCVLRTTVLYVRTRTVSSVCTQGTVSYDTVPQEVLQYVLSYDMMPCVRIIACFSFTVSRFHDFTCHVP